MALNVALIRRIILWIRLHPEEYDQWGCTRCIGALGYYLGTPIPRRQWKKHPVHLLGKGGARALMGLPSRHKLFVMFPQLWWPEPYATQWRNATTKKDRARVAVRRLQHLVKTGK